MDVENEPIVKDGEEEYGAELTSIYRGPVTPCITSRDSSCMVVFRNSMDIGILNMSENRACCSILK